MRSCLLTVLLFVYVHSRKVFLQNVSDQARQSYYTILKNSTATTAEKQTSLLNWASFYGVQNFDVNTALTSNTVGGYRAFDSSEEKGRGNGRGGRRSTTRSPFGNNNGGINNGFNGGNRGFGGVGNGAFPSSGQNSQFGQGSSQFGSGRGSFGNSGQFGSDLSGRNSQSGSSQFGSGQGFGQGSSFGQFGSNQAFGSSFGQNSGLFAPYGEKK